MVLRYLKIKSSSWEDSDGDGNTLDSVLEFDVKKNQVKKMARLPCALLGMATVRWRDKVVVLGGRDGEDNTLNDVYMYDCKTGKITALPPMLEKRYLCCAVITGDTIVVMVGMNENCHNLSSVECFTMGGSTWEYLPAMNEARYGEQLLTFYHRRENMCDFNICMDNLNLFIHNKHQRTLLRYSKT